MLGSDKMSGPPHGPHEMGENHPPQLQVPAPEDQVQAATALLAGMVVGVNHPPPPPAVPMPGQSLETSTSALEAATAMLGNMGLGPDAALLVERHVTPAVYASPVAQRAMQSDPRPQPAGPIRRPRARNGVSFAQHPYSRAVRRLSQAFDDAEESPTSATTDENSLQHQTVSALIGTIFGKPPEKE